MGDLIRTGQINKLLLRPISPLFDTLASEVAGKVVYLVFLVPVLLMLALVLKPELQPTLTGLLAFLPALFLAWVLRFFWGYWLALLAFWTLARTRSWPCKILLSFYWRAGGSRGTVTWFAATLAVILPFRYMVAFPVEVLMGRLDKGELLTGFGIQICWTLLVLAYIFFCGAVDCAIIRLLEVKMQSWRL